MILQDFDKILIYEHQHTLDEHMVIDLLLAKEVKEKEMIVRFWVSEGVVLGKLDTTLSNYQRGLSYLKQQGFETVIRRSGGLAVVLDNQTLNVSLIVSKNGSKLELHSYYKKAVSLVQQFFNLYHVTVEQKEVPQSYCPGMYDCVIDDYKFCGIAQYHTKNEAIIMLNMVVDGNQIKRLSHMKHFYEISNTLFNKNFPRVDVNSMKSLSYLLNRKINTDDLISDLKEFISSENNHVEILEKLML